MHEFATQSRLSTSIAGSSRTKAELFFFHLMLDLHGSCLWNFPLDRFVSMVVEGTPTLHTGEVSPQTAGAFGTGKKRPQNMPSAITDAPVVSYSPYEYSVFDVGQAVK